MTNKSMKNLIFTSVIAVGLSLSPILVAPARAASPTLMTTTATGVTQTSATLNGFFSYTNATSIDVRFEYGTTPLLGSTTSYQTFSATSGTFSATIPVTPGQEYFFRAMGVVTLQTPGFGSTLSFVAPGYQLPTVMTLAANPVDTTTATLNGFYNSNGTSTSTKFQYANNSAFIGLYNTPSVVQGNSSGQFSTNITGLTPDTTYYVRAVATNSAGSVVGTTAISFHTLAIIVPTYQCNDGIDNDGDGLIDYPSDPGCTSATDNSEVNIIATYQCNDGVDNDGDGLVDFPQDPGCSSATDNNEFNLPPTVYQCNDGVDNDGDGLVDFPQDPGCSSATDNSEFNVTTTYQCNDGVDNDSDGLVDYPADPGCSSATDNSEYNVTTTYQCNDGVDNDSDGEIDYPDDPGCTSNTDNSEYNSSSGNAPEVEVDSATNIDEDSAELNGTVDGNGSSTTAWFEWGTSTSVNNDTSHVSVGSGFDDFSRTITGLDSDETYYFRICASNSYGSDCSNTLHFTTDDNNGNGNGDEPTANTSSAINITSTSANLRGYVDPNDDTPAEVWFEYGTNSNLNRSTNTDDVWSNQSVSEYVYNLTPGTTYFFRVCASNDSGDDCGQTLNFTTTGATTPTYPPYVPPTPAPNPAPIIIYQTVDGGGNTILATLNLTASAREVARGNNIIYIAKLTNTSTRKITNVEIKIQAPSDLALTFASDGEISFASNTMTLKIASMNAGESKSVTVTAKANEETRNDSFIVGAEATYLNTKTNIRETVTDETMTSVIGGSVLGASAFGAGAPSITVWLGIILAGLAIFAIASRSFVRKTATPPPSTLN